ncbi:MAG: energy transducer TonB [Nibricoccus sp.]
MKVLRKLSLAIVFAFILLNGCSAPSSQSSIQPQTADTAPSFQGDAYNLKDLDAQPIPSNRVQPMYAFALKKAGIEGKVVLGAIVTEEGIITQIRVIEASHPSFAVASIEALKKWRWKPGQKNGRPVACKIEQPFFFTMRN